MKKLEKNEMKKIIGGFALGFTLGKCAIQCVDKQFHYTDCGAYNCETTPQNKVNCTDSKGAIVGGSKDPCEGVTGVTGVLVP
jgi:hypothetical protein